MDLTSIGITLIGVGVGLIAFGKLLKQFIRGVVDNKINGKEVEANEAAKNSASAVNKYRALKRRYDDENR